MPGFMCPLFWGRSSEVDLILSDINMGEGEADGYAFLKAVRGNGHANVPFYFVSGMSRADEEPRAIERGADGYLQLPVDESQFRVLVSTQ